MRTKLEVLVLGIMLLFLGGANLKAWGLSRQLREVTVARDSIAADFASARAEAEGFTVAFAQERVNLTRALMKRDSTLARVLSDYQASRIEVTSYVELLAVAEGRIESLGTAVAATDSTPESWAGELDDGLLIGSWGLQPPLLTLQYTVSPQIELIQGLSGDGRLLVTARASDPRVTLRINDLLFEPPAAQVVTRTNWKRLFVASFLSFGAGLVTWEVVR